MPLYHTLKDEIIPDYINWLESQKDLSRKDSDVLEDFKKRLLQDNF